MDLDSLNKVVLFVTSLIDHLNDAPTITKILIYLIIAIVVASLIIGGLKLILEQLASIVENLKKVGWPLGNGQEEKMVVRRRQQFCSVLRSDLDAIAKAENWNDQWFTDLEAEVEAEGGYYVNALARLLRRQSTGIRRVPSLMQAIQSSAERCMMLVGDPGSGKSVALRHLGRTLADEGSKSKSVHTKIPLYINLKEIPHCNVEDLSPDFIEKFVIEHIRRGDADTAAYVRDHWQVYKTLGLWFFLFDSFDEMPAVLHAPNGSKTIEHYSQALRKFMDGMGECRGVLASREYKGPEAIPWQKLRILALNQQRQDELIDNTYLDAQNKILVRQHLATIGAGIFGNPLFLSLLCRYVGDTKQVPSSDYDLLLRHIQRLAQRDPDFVSKRYGLSTQELLDGATILAVLFAEERNLSLAPTHNEIQQALARRQKALPNELERLLSALIDVKIGRSDVKEARLGDRRFTFAHRRYQETLFVQYLANHPYHLSAEDLLLQDRWREFTVTLIQSQPDSVVRRITDEATRQIDSLPLTCLKLPLELGEDLCCYDWSDSALVSLLQLLNEGFSNRSHMVPNTLRAAVERQLMPRWENGDLYDKLMVLRYGRLLPLEIYQHMLTWAIESSLDEFLQAGFSNAQFVAEFPAKTEKWIRRRFSNEVLTADSKIALRKLDAFGNRLPKSLGATVIFKRCETLRSLIFQPLLVRILNAYLDNVFSKIPLLRKIKFERPHTRILRTITIYAYLLVLPITAAVAYVVEATSLASAQIVFISLAAAMCMPIFSLGLRDEPQPLNLAHLARRAFGTLVTLRLSRETSQRALARLALITASSLIAWMLFKYETAQAIFASFILIFPLAIVTTDRLGRRHALRRLNEAVNTEPSMWAQIKRARSAEELLVWLKENSHEWLAEPTNIRSILRYAETHLELPRAASSAIDPIGVVLETRAIAKYLLDRLDSTHGATDKSFAE